MKQVDTILAYEEILREIDFFVWAAWKNTDKYRTQIVSILESWTNIDDLVRAIQWVKEHTFRWWELSVLRKVARELGSEFITAHSKEFMFWLNYYIESCFRNFDIPEPEKLLSSHLKQLTQDNFNDILSEIYTHYGDTWVLVFLRECIAQWKMLNDVWKYVLSVMQEFWENDFNFWEYRNVARLSAVKESVEQKESIYESVNISLSWGNMNGFAHIWVIEWILESGKNISFISWSSMWALIWVIASKVLDPQNSPHDNLKKWKEIQEYFLSGIHGEFLKWYIFRSEDREKMKEFFLSLWAIIGIDERTTFSKLSIPIVVNGSRYHSKGEQQIYMSQDDTVIKSMLASVNIYGKYFWDTQLEDTLIGDHAASKQINPTEALKILGIYGENTCVVDTGSGSSDMQRTWIPERLIRKSYPDTTRRDVLERLTVKLKQGKIIAPDLRQIYGLLSSKSAMNIGFYIDPEIIQSLIKLWRMEAIDQFLS